LDSKQQFNEKSKRILEAGVDGVYTHKENFALAKDHKEWEASLEVGDYIDCLKTETVAHRVCWSQAEITGKRGVAGGDDEEPTHFEFTLRYLEDNDNAIRVLSTLEAAHEIAPFGTKCEDMDFRMNLKKGDLIDCNDTS
jgi:hypothetical protein